MAVGGAISPGSMLFAILLVSSAKAPFSDQRNGPNSNLDALMLEPHG